MLKRFGSHLQGSTALLVADRFWLGYMAALLFVDIFQQVRGRWNGYSKNE
jgi:hypothetical protein